MGSDFDRGALVFGMHGFNSRSRMGSDGGDHLPVFALLVSIRAPAWGATLSVSLIVRKLIVSIRAPAWGAMTRTARFFITALFQFALPHGERHGLTVIRRLANLFQFALPHGERLNSVFKLVF